MVIKPFPKNILSDMSGGWNIPSLDRVIIDKGYADLALIKPGENKLSARILNSKTGVQKNYKVDKSFLRLH
jgi:hypothetical protein